MFTLKLVVGQLGRSPPIEDPEGDALGAMHRALLRMENTLRDLKDLARLERPEFAFRFVSLDLGELVAESLRAVRPQFAAASVETTLVIEPGVSEVRGDRLLDRVFRFLLADAHRVAPPGGRVEVWVGRDGGSVTVEVTDRACGPVPPSGAPAGATLHDTVGGRVAHRIAEAHGARLEAFDADGAGTLRRFTLPDAGAIAPLEAGGVCP